MSPPAIGKLAVVHAFYQLAANDKTERRCISGARLQAGAAISPDIANDKRVAAALAPGVSPAGSAEPQLAEFASQGVSSVKWIERIPSAVAPVALVALASMNTSRRIGPQR